MTTMTATDPAIEEFATAVRAALGDLPADEVDDLTDGLEADLTERKADGGPALGDPASYAEELRSAAGLPPRGPAQRPGLVDTELIRHNLRQLRDDTARVIRSNPFLSGTADLLASMRPAWWVARGLLLFGLFSISWLNSSGERIPEAIWVVAAAWVVVSVQWGRGRWLPRTGRRVIPIVATIVALLAIGPVAVAIDVYNTRQDYQLYGDEYNGPLGLQLEGQTVSNVFAYGADGELLTDVQLFDQNGEPLNITDPQYGETFFEGNQGDDLVLLVPRDSAPGAGGWNVFPLMQREADCYDETLACARRSSDTEPPFERVQPLIGATLPMSPTNAPTDDDDK